MSVIYDLVEHMKGIALLYLSWWVSSSTSWTSECYLHIAILFTW